MKIGLYFGSFNPVHTGHLIIASFMADNGGLDEVWMVVSPQNPFKNSTSLLNERHRYALIQLAVEGEKKIKASNVEFKLPKPSYTIDTLTYLQEKYPRHTFSLILGSDSFQNINDWKNSKQILNNYNINIYLRPGFSLNKHESVNIKIMQAPMLDISATLIRKNIKEKKSIRYLVPDEVMKEIAAKNYYGPASENPSE